MAGRLRLLDRPGHFLDARDPRVVGGSDDILREAAGGVEVNGAERKLSLPGEIGEIVAVVSPPWHDHGAGQAWARVPSPLGQAGGYPSRLGMLYELVDAGTSAERRCVVIHPQLIRRRVGREE